MQLTKKHKIHTHKHKRIYALCAQWIYEMCPVGHNPIQTPENCKNCWSNCAYDFTTSVHNTTVLEVSSGAKWGKTSAEYST